MSTKERQRILYNFHIPGKTNAKSPASLCAEAGLLSRIRKKEKGEQREFVGARPLHLAAARPFGRLKAPLGLSLFRFAPQTRIVYFFVLGAISNMTVTRIYKPYSNQVMVLFQGKLISGWFNANTINAIAIISIIKPRILDIRFFMQSTSLSNWNC